MLFSSVGTLQLPVGSQIFMSVSSMKIEHSRSAWSTFLNWGMTVTWAATATSRMQWTSKHHTSPVSYSLSLTAHLIIINVIKRRKYIMKGTFMIPQSSSAKERFEYSGSSWLLLMRPAELRAELPSMHSLHTCAPGVKCTWSCPPSYTFPYPEQLEPLIISHSDLAERETGRTQVSGQWNCAWVMCWGTGRGEHPALPTATPFLPSPSQLSSKSALASPCCGIQSRAVSASAKGLQHAAEHQGHRILPAHLSCSSGCDFSSRAPTCPKGSQLSSFLPEGPPQQHRMQTPASAVLHSIC